MTYAKGSKDIDEYISNFPAEVRSQLEKLRETIKSEAAAAEETINYGIPTFKLNNKNLVHFAAYKHHIGFYPAPSAIKAFKKELSKWESAKGSVKFPLNEKVPFDLIREIVRFRVNESNNP